MPSASHLPSPTWVEQFGRVIVEAQASGPVVVGYASGAIAEVAGEAGIVVPTGDVERLADAVARVIADPDEFAWRREAGRVQAVTRTWHAVATRQAALYKTVHGDRDASLKLPRSPRERRAGARAEFGATARTIAGERPFALPILRRGGAVACGLAAAIDATREIARRLWR
jgi:Glycosyl transferases group 1